MEYSTLLCLDIAGNESLGRSQCADHDVVPVRVTECELHRSGVGTHVRLLFKASHKCASSRQCFREIIYAEEQKQSIARLGVIRTGQWRVLVGSPLMETKQDCPVRVNDLAKIIMSRRRLRLSKQRLIPLEAASNISNADDCPRTLHRSLLRPNRLLKSE